MLLRSLPLVVMPNGQGQDSEWRNPLSHGPLAQSVPRLPSNPASPGFYTWEYWGLFQLTGTRTLELEPDEVEDVLRVTATVLGFPSRPEEFCSSSYRLPMIGVLERTQSTCSSISLTLLWCIELLYPAATKNCLFDEKLEKFNVTLGSFF